MKIKETIICLLNNVEYEDKYYDKILNILINKEEKKTLDLRCAPDYIVHLLSTCKYQDYAYQEIIDILEGKKEKAPLPETKHETLAKKVGTQEYLSVNEVSQVLGVSPKTVYMWKWARKYELPGKKLGKRFFYRAKEIYDLIGKVAGRDRKNRQN